MNQSSEPTGCIRTGCCATILGMVLLVGAPTPATAGCDKCPTPDVLNFDFAVTPPAPPNNQDHIEELLDWLGLHSIGKFASGALMNNNNMCINFIDGDVALTGRVRKGAGKSFPPPPGEIELGDYLFTGEISQDESGYHMSVVLETACSRQTVVSASAPFTADRVIKVDPKDWPGNPNDHLPGNPTAEQVLSGEWEAPLVKGDGLDGTDIASELVREHFTPLLPKIREFELKLRDTDTRVAIDQTNGGTLDMEPSKRHAKPGETVPIAFTLTDCDGEPLRGRVILMTPREKWWGPSSHNGRFAAATATTNDSGKVTVDYKVGDMPGVSTARVYFSYLKPSGCEMIGGNETVINVEAAREYHGMARFNSPVVATSAVADITWTLIEKPKDEEADIEESSQEFRYLASGTISGDLNVPDCDPKHVDLTIKPDDNGELTIYPDDQNYSFAFSSEAEITLMCGKPRRPWVIWGASVFHFDGGVCNGLAPYTDLKTLKGEGKCESGMIGTTSWEYKAVRQ